MKSTLMWIVLGGAILLFGGTADAWGGLFNRFSPEMLANMGYGNHGGGYHSFLQESNKTAGVMRFTVTKNKNDTSDDILEVIVIKNKKLFNPLQLLNMLWPGWQNISKKEGYMDDEPVLQEEPCYGKSCSSNEYCCPGSICVYVDEVNEGKCLFLYGRKLGELCRQDSDCEAGLTCDSVGPNGGLVCRAPLAMAKQYAEDCSTSSECDITRGLCCQLQRRHRQAPRKVCSYFKDPLTCIGTVAVDQIKHEVQHTAGEKRLTSAFKHGLN